MQGVPQRAARRYTIVRRAVSLMCQLSTMQQMGRAVVFHRQSVPATTGAAPSKAAAAAGESSAAATPKPATSESSAAKAAGNPAAAAEDGKKDENKSNHRGDSCDQQRARDEPRRGADKTRADHRTPEIAEDGTQDGAGNRHGEEQDDEQGSEIEASSAPTRCALLPGRRQRLAFGDNLDNAIDTRTD